MCSCFNKQTQHDELTFSRVLIHTIGHMQFLYFIRRPENWSTLILDFYGRFVPWMQVSFNMLFHREVHQDFCKSFDDFHTIVKALQFLWSFCPLFDSASEIYRDLSWSTCPFTCYHGELTLIMSFLKLQLNWHDTNGPLGHGKISSTLVITSCHCWTLTHTLQRDTAAHQPTKIWMMQQTC